MPKAVVGFPVHSVKNSVFEQIDGWPKNWIKLGLGPIKQVSFIGNTNYSRARVKTFIIPGGAIKIKAGVEVTDIVSISRSKELQFVVLFMNYELPFDAFKKFLKFGNQGARDLFESKLGISLDSRSFVNATCILDDSSTGSKAMDGTLTGPRGTSDFYFEVAYGLGVAGITAERVQLEYATKATFMPGIFAMRARKALAHTENWLSIPTSDSTRLFQDFASLRESLQLSQRMEQVRRSLTHQTAQVNKLLGYFLSLLTLSASLAALASVVSKELFIYVSLSALMAAVAAILTLVWQIARRWRR